MSGTAPGPEVATWLMASPALEVPTLYSGNCASWDRQKPTPLELAPPGAVDQPGGGVHSSWAAAGKAEPASIAPAAAKVSRASRARRVRFAWVLIDPPCGELAADRYLCERRTLLWSVEEGP